MVFTEKFYTVPEAAEQVRLSPWTIWDLLKRGKLVRTKVAGRTFLRESELLKLVVDQVNPKPPRAAKAEARNAAAKSKSKQNATADAR